MSVSPLEVAVGMSGSAWQWVGLENGFWRSLNLNRLLDFCFKGRFILYGVCFMVFRLCDLSVYLHV